MKNLRIPVLAGLVAVSSFVAHAEPPAPPSVQSQTPAAAPGEPAKGDRAARAKERMQKMQADLGLTDEQSQKVQAILSEQRQAGKSIKADATLTDEQKKEKMKAGRTEAEAKIAAVLTPEQKAKWDQIKKNRPAKGGNP